MVVVLVAAIVAWWFKDTRYYKVTSTGYESYIVGGTAFGLEMIIDLASKRYYTLMFYRLRRPSFASDEWATPLTGYHDSVIKFQPQSIWGDPPPRY